MIRRIIFFFVPIFAAASLSAQFDLEQLRKIQSAMSNRQVRGMQTGANDPMSSMPANRRIESALATGETERALSTIESSLADPQISKATAAELRWLKAIALSVQKKSPEADAAWDQSLAAAKDSQNAELVVHNLAGQSFWGQDRDDASAFQRWEECKEFAQHSAPSAALARALNLAGISHFKLRNLVEAEEAWSLAVSASKDLPNDDLDRLACRHNLALFLVRKALVQESDSMAIITTADDLMRGALDAVPTNLSGRLIKASLTLNLSRVADLKDDAVARDKYAAQYRRLLEDCSDNDLEAFQKASTQPTWSTSTDGFDVPATARLMAGISDAREDIKVESRKSSGAPPSVALNLVRQASASFNYLHALAEAQDWKGTSAPADDPITAQLRMAERMGAKITPEQRKKIEDARKQFDPEKMKAEMAKKDPRVAQVLAGSRQDKLEPLLARLPVSGRGSCSTNGWTTLMDAAPGNYGDEVREALPGLYDVERIPGPKLMNLLPLARIGGSFADELYAVGLDFTGGRLHDSAASGLYDCGFDRSVWQLSELSMAVSLDIQRRIMEKVRAPGGAIGIADLAKTEADVNEAFIQTLGHMQRLEGNHDPKLRQQELASIAEAERANGLWHDQVLSLLSETAKRPVTFARLDSLKRLIGEKDVYCVIKGGGNENIWFVTAISCPAGRDPEVLMERIHMPTLLVDQFQHGVFGGESVASTADLAQLGRRVFNRLFPGEIGKRLRAAERVVLAPSQNAWAIPYPALVLNESGTPQYLGMEKNLSLVESLAFWEELERPWNKPGGEPLVVGDIKYDSADHQMWTPARYGIASLLPLPANAGAANEIAALYKSSVLSGDRAQESAIRAALTRAPVVHFGTHGFALGGTDVPMMASEMVRRIKSGAAGLWLSGISSAETNAAADGLLQAWEIRHQLTLNADVVVLAACNAGGAMGLLSNGPDLPDAFLYAGARSVLAPLSAVRDEPTARLVTAFHKKIKAGQRKDEALRMAVRELAANPAFGHPINWGTFELFGSARNNFSQN
jgi:hypothetical protein